MPQKIEISPRTILFIAGFVGLIWLVLYIKDILFLLFISFIFMSAMRPVVEKLVSWSVPRALGILLVYIAVITVFVIVGTFIVPPLVEQTVRLVTNLPEFLEPLSPYVQLDFNTVLGQIAPLGQNVARFTLGIFSNVLTIFTILVFSFYFLLERKNLKTYLMALVGTEMADRTLNIVRKAENRMGAWVNGQLVLMIIIGTTCYIGLSLLGVSYALPLALVAGLLEAVPIIGPNIAAVPAILVAFTISPWLAAAVAALYFIVQQVENNILVPTVMRRAVGVPPLASLLALMVGGRLAGVLGAILAVPILLAAQTILEEILKPKQA